MSDAVLIEARGVHKHFPMRTSGFGAAAMVRAVDGVDLGIRKGETLGLVGESGCGKSTLGRLFLRLIEPTDGAILHKGTDLTSCAAARCGRDGAICRSSSRIRSARSIRARRWARSSPRPMPSTASARRAERARWVAETLDLVALPRDAARRYPHEFSGGQRQRIGIARALALKPEFVVCDEAVSALDVSVQSQIINLMQDLQQELGLTYLFISHNLAVVRHISTRIAVMYLGRIVELAEADALFARPVHPYTRALLSAVPVSHPDQPRHRHMLRGDVPSATAVPKGCRFAPRCRFAEPRCRELDPALTTLADGRAVACLLAADGTLPIEPSA